MFMVRSIAGKGSAVGVVLRIPVGVEGGVEGHGEVRDLDPHLVGDEVRNDVETGEVGGEHRLQRRGGAVAPAANLRLVDDHGVLACVRFEAAAAGGGGLEQEVMGWRQVEGHGVLP